MAESAESVVVELEARLGNYQSQISQGVNAFDAGMKRMQASASATEKSVGSSFGNMRIAQLEGMHVMTALSDSYAAGIPISRSLGMEMGRLVEMLELVSMNAKGGEGAFGAFASVMKGPWGMALSAGIMLLSQLALGHKDAEESSKKQETIENLLIRTLNGEAEATKKLTEAIREKTKAAREAIETDRERVRGEFHQQQRDLETAEHARPDLLKKRNEAQANYRSAVGMAGHPDPSAPEGQAAGLSAARAAAAKAVADFNANEARIQSLRELAATTQVQLLKMESAAHTDESKAIARRAEAAEHDALVIRDREMRAAKENTGLQKAANARYVAALDRVAEERKKEEKELAERNKKEPKPHFGRDIAEANNAELLTTAQKFMGDRENTPKGKSALEALFAEANIHIDPEKVKWCAAFVNSVLAVNHLPGTGSLAARSFQTYGTDSTRNPEKGDIVTLRLGGSSAVNHVGFFAGFDGKGNVRVTGGNQGNRVSTETFAASSVASFRRAPTADQAAKLAEAAAKHEANDDRAYQAELGQAQDRYARAQLALADTAEGRYKLEIDELRAAKVQRDLQIDDELKAGKITKVEADRLKQLNADTEALGETAAKRREGATLVDQQLEHERTAIGATLLILGLQQDLADTTKERKAISLQILEYQEREARATLAAAIAKEHDPARLADLQTRMGTIGPEFALKRQGLDRQYETPGQRFMRDLNAKDINAELQKVEVEGLNALEDSLSGVISGTKSVTSAFKDMASQIIASLARIAIQEMIIKPLAHQLFGGSGGGGGGGLGGLLNGLFGSGGSGGSFIPPGFGDSGGGGFPSFSPDLEGLPGRAGGGPVVAGKLYRVNEAGGAEGFVPQGSGTIIPLGRMAQAQRGGGTTVVQPIHFDLRGAVMTTDILAQMNALADDAARRGAIGGLAMTQRETSRAQLRRLA